MSNILNWFFEYRERKLALKHEREEKSREELRALREKQRQCGESGHLWGEPSFKVQGDGDPNVEGYVLLTTRTCWCCGLTDTDIEPYEDEED